VQQVLNRIRPDAELDQIYESTRHIVPPCSNLAEIALAFNAISVRLGQGVRTKGSIMAEFDFILTGGTVIDGSGAAGRRADVAVSAGKIAAIGDGRDWTAATVIDASGQVVAPGFIDVHTHDDNAVWREPDMPFKITQGVTSIIAGNCGISAAPLTHRDDLPPPFSLSMQDPDNCFPTVARYRAKVEAAQPAVNVALLAGHSSLRATVMGADLDRPARADEITAMVALLETAIRDGAIGLSSGLDYPPALSAPSAELVALATVLKRFPGTVYTTHMRDEADEVEAAVAESIDTAGQAGVPLVISHHKCAGIANFGKSVQTLAMIAKAQAHQQVGLDVYPYTASSSSLIRRFLPAADDILINHSRSHPEMAGRMLNDIAAEWGISREEATDRLHPAGAIYFDMDERDLQRIMAFPTSMIGSDGIPGTASPHPRLWGTFPRVLGHYARDLGLMPLERAVHKMTGLSAANFGFSDRGRVATGYLADLVVFDPETVLDVATFDDPERPSVGISHVLVNGVPALLDGQLTGQRAGQFLTH
jgi:N-acyl-D-amino-acid deacylase